MNTDYDELRSMIEDHGVHRVDAEKAINNCVKPMAKGAVKTYFAAGIAMYFMNTSPASAIEYGTLAAGLSAGRAFLNSDECARVRQALDFWNTTND